jgi:hypothetical protein
VPTYEMSAQKQVIYQIYFDAPKFLVLLLKNIDD